MNVENVTGAPKLSDSAGVDVEPQTLERLGWSHAFASRQVADVDLRRFLEKKNIGPLHFWNLLTLRPDRAAIDQLYEFESQEKSTEIFFYYGQPRDASRPPVLFATGSVASRIGKRFGYAGLPVLNRCLIAPPYRQCGLYGAVLRHRFEHCRRQWGDQLLGIHLATAQASVFRALMGHESFLYMGNQFMGDPANRIVAAAYLWLPPKRVVELVAAPQDERVAASWPWRRFALYLQKFVENRFEDGDYAELLTRAHEAARTTGFDPLTQNGLRELFNLFEAVPVNPHPTPGLPFASEPEFAKRPSALTRWRTS